MKLTANRKALAEAARAALVPSTAHHLSILGCLRIDAEGATATITGSNLATTIAVRVSADVRKQGSVVVPGRILADLLKSMADEVVTIDVEEEADHEARVVCGRTEASLRCHKLEDWPAIVLATANEVEFSPTDIARVAAVVRAVATDSKAIDNRPVIGGVHFTGSRAEATEGSVFVMADLGVTDLPDIVVPGDVVSRVVKASPEGVMVGFSSRAVTFTSAAATISWTSQLIEGDYPDMIRWLRKDSKHALTMERQALDRALSVVKTLADAGDFQPVDLTFEDDLLVLTANRTDVGDIRDVVPCTSTFEFPMRFHIQFLDLLCDLLDGDEVTLEIEEAMKPVIARSADWRLAVIVGPMKPAS